MAFVEQYSPATFNSTPELPQALQSHANAGGNDWVKEKFGPLFRKHRVDNLLGIALLHHHFTLEEGEFLTDVGGTSTVWKSQTGTRPCVWAIGAEKPCVLPLEFSMDGDESTVDYPDWTQLRPFLEELSTVFADLGVGQTYGLVRYPGDDFPGRVEMTVGRANVNLTPKQAAKHDPASHSQTAWFFTEDIQKRGCTCNCFHHGTPRSDHTHIPTIVD